MPYFDWFYVVLAEYDPNTRAPIDDDTLCHIFTCVALHDDIKFMLKECYREGVRIVAKYRKQWIILLKSAKR